MKASKETVAKILVNILQFGTFGKSFTPFKMSDRKEIVAYMEANDLISFAPNLQLTDRGLEIAKDSTQFAK
jgi:hypothetical protein